MLLAVLWRLRYKFGFRDVAELLLQRGYEVTHDTIRGWEARFAPLLAERLRARRRGKASPVLVFTNEVGRPLRRHNVLRCLQNLLEREGLPVPALTGSGTWPPHRCTRGAFLTGRSWRSRGTQTCG